MASARQEEEKASGHYAAVVSQPFAGRAQPMQDMMKMNSSPAGLRNV